MSTDDRIENYECPRCSAWVRDLERHRGWHRELEGTDEPTPDDGPTRYWVLDR